MPLSCRHFIYDTEEISCRRKRRRRRLIKQIPPKHTDISAMLKVHQWFVSWSSRLGESYPRLASLACSLPLVTAFRCRYVRLLCSRIQRFVIADQITIRIVKKNINVPARSVGRRHSLGVFLGCLLQSSISISGRSQMSSTWAATFTTHAKWNHPGRS